MLNLSTIQGLYPGPNRRSANPLNELGRQWDDICKQAVAPGEIMVALEAAGYNDDTARERYGCIDLLDCAEQLYMRVPYRPSLLDQEQRLPAPQVWLPLLRGLTYLLPAAWLPLTALLWPAESASVGWATATLFCWGWGQLIAYLGYRALGRQHQGQAAVFIRLLGTGGLVLTALLALLMGVLLHRPLGPTVAVALLTGTYLFSAYALFMYGRVFTLFAVTLPAVLLGLGLNLLPAQLVGLRDLGAAGVLAFAVGVPLVMTLYLTRQAERPLWPGRNEWLLASGFAMYGWSCASFLAWATITGATIAPLEGLTGSLILVPLILSMGMMEWLVERLLRQLRFLSQSTLSLEQLILSGQKALVSSLGWYVLALVLLHLILAAVATSTVSTVHVLGQVLFGMAAMVSAILLAVERLKMVVISWLVSLGLLVVINVLPSGTFLSASGIFLLDVQVLLFSLLLSVTVALFDINSYR
ncbi:hypothetical protein ACI3L1_19050 [Deinococcus sp. SM5_A1]|uniref:hypothetical protein n=1 Tax=Deinococcus sp. SM5_A1 TaxID=3379094 RepID=UPI00385DB952